MFMNNNKIQLEQKLMTFDLRQNLKCYHSKRHTQLVYKQLLQKMLEGTVKIGKF